jgi:hypothetical protein
MIDDETHIYGLTQILRETQLARSLLVALFTIISYLFDVVVCTLKPNIR